MMTKDYQKRAERFENLVKNKPKPGKIITSLDGKPVPVYVEVDPLGKRRVVYTNALIDDEATDWFLTRELRGLKVLILPKSQEVLIKENGGSLENLVVTALRVVRHNKKGTALIAELVEKGEL